MSVVIPTYNCESRIVRAVSSVVNQTYANIECVVVDDGSTDGTREALAPLGMRIKYVRQENAGAAAARNAGIEISAGEFVAFLDADDYWMPEKTEEQLRIFADHPEIELVYCDFVLLPAEGDSRSISARRNPEVADDVAVIRDFSVLFKEPYLGTPTIMVRAAGLRSIGGFDPTLSVGEDVDLYFRLLKNHRSYAHLRRPLVVIERRDDSLSTKLSGYADNLRVIDKLESAWPEFVAQHHELVAAQRFAIYERWAKDLLFRGRGADARSVLKASRSMGFKGKFARLYLKSFLSGALARLRFRRNGGQNPGG